MTITADTLPIFPRCPSFGFTAIPQILTKHTQREGGYEKSTRKWSEPLRAFNSVPLGEQLEADMYAVLNFHRAIGGTSGLFRFKDYTDYSSGVLGATVSRLDQPFQIESGSPGGYLLVKAYTYGALTEYRRIYRPLGSTFLVANAGGVNQTDYVLDESRGILTPGGTFSGVPTSWGAEFYIKARFAVDPEFEISNHKIQRVTVQIVERRET